MKIAIAGKGGVGKTTIAAWLGDYLARSGKDVVMIDADTALSLGPASGLDWDELPVPLIERKDLVKQYIGTGMLNLNPDVSGLAGELLVDLPVSENGGKAGTKRLILMGGPSQGGTGCACGANALLKAVLAEMITEGDQWVIVDLEAGVEHLGRGTVEHVDALVVVSEPSARSLRVAGDIARMAFEIGVDRHLLVLNRWPEGAGEPPKMEGFGEPVLSPVSNELAHRQLRDPAVLGLSDAGADELCREVLARIDL